MRPGGGPQGWGWGLRSTFPDRARRWPLLPLTAPRCFRCILTDPGSGAKYYYNRATEETEWVTGEKEQSKRIGDAFKGVHPRAVMSAGAPNDTCIP